MGLIYWWARLASKMPPLGQFPARRLGHFLRCLKRGAGDCPGSDDPALCRNICRLVPTRELRVAAKPPRRADPQPQAGIAHTTTCRDFDPPPTANDNGNQTAQAEQPSIPCASSHSSTRACCSGPTHSPTSCGRNRRRQRSRCSKMRISKSRFRAGRSVAVVRFMIGDARRGQATLAADTGVFSRKSTPVCRSLGSNRRASPLFETNS